MLKQILCALAGIVLAPILAVSPAQAQMRLFSEQSELEMVIEGPIGELTRRAARNTDPLAAIVTVAGSDTRHDIQLSPRGISRRVGGFCSFPPLRLDFDGDTVRGSVFQGQNRLKLVVRCRPGGRYEQINALEYTAYRLYNLLTPVSYRVRPVRVTYRDGRRDSVQLNFLVEDIDDMAHRNRLVAIEVGPQEVAPAQLDAAGATRVALFQYMIGNLDWDMVRANTNEEDCCHNGRLLASSASVRQGVTPIPHDFDYSGFVNAPYAVPPESLPVRNVRQRYFRGYCRFNDEIPAAIAHFQSRRAALLEAIDTEPRLSDASKRRAREYIEGFFEVVGDPRAVERNLVGNCR